MELIVLVLALVVLGVLAVRYGHDSRPGIGDIGAIMRRDGLVVYDDGSLPRPEPVVPVRADRNWSYRLWLVLTHS